MGFRIGKGAVVIFALLSCATSAHAQSEDSLQHLPTKEVEITALRPSDLPTIDPRGAEIKSTATLLCQTGTYLASDALRAISSSLDIRRYGTLGAIAIPSFRGLPTEYTIVYRDGIRLTNEQLGLTDLGQLSLRGMSHVELIPGSSSIELGGDAIGAAINIVTSRSDTALIRIGTEQTGFAHGSGLPIHSYSVASGFSPIDGVAIVFGGAIDGSNGAFPFFDTTRKAYILRENNDALIQTVYLSASWIVNAETDIRLIGNYFHAERGVPGPITASGLGATSLVSRQLDDQALAALKVEHIAGPFSGSVVLSVNQQFENFKYQEHQVDTSNDHIISLGASGKYEISSFLTGFGGLEYMHTSLTGTTDRTAAGDTILLRDRQSIFAAVRAAPIGNLSATGSVRCEKISGMSEVETLPQFAAEYEPVTDLRVSAAFSRTFHAPTLNDLYWHGAGNDTLHPERGVNTQVVASYLYRWTHSDVSFGITGFLSSIDDEIIWLPGARDYSPVNVGHVDSRGLEFRASGDLGFSDNWSIHVEESYTILKAMNKTDDPTLLNKELLYTTPTASLLIATIQSEEIGSLSVLARYRGHKFIDPENYEAPLPPVTTLDLSFATRNFRFNRLGWKALLTIDNLTDKQFQESAGYPLPGRSYKIALELNY